MFGVLNCEYLSIDTKLGHRINNAQKGGDRFCLLPNLRLVNLEIQCVVFKILLDLVSIDIVHILVRYCQNSAPSLVACCQLGVFGIKDAIEKREVVGDLLVSFDVKAVLGLLDRCSKV